MAPVIMDNLDAIRALCREYGVARLDVFGSATRDDFDPGRSDVDFAVEFVPVPPGEHARAYFGLLAGLGQLLGRPVDLIEPRAVRNPYRRREIEASQATLYAAA